MTDPAGRRVLTELYAGQGRTADAEVGMTAEQAKQGQDAF
jgi:hypothetical protein